MFTMGGVGPAQADGGPHVSHQATVAGNLVVSDAAGRCATCHRAHTAKASFLLIQAEPALCYTCHDSTGIASTDVQDGQTPGGLALRGGGFDKAKIDSGNASRDWTANLVNGVADGTFTGSNPVVPALGTAVAGQSTTSRHQIGTPGTEWGNGYLNSGVGQGVTLECTSCHDPHGNGNFRILKATPSNSQWKLVPPVADNPATRSVDESLTPAVNVVIPDSTTQGYTTTNYWSPGANGSLTNVGAPGGTAFTNGTSSVGTGAAAPDGYIQNIAAWCTTCHTRYLASSKSYKNANQGYPTVDGATGGTVDTTYTYRHRSDANYKQNAANCITCHVSHGSNAAINGAGMGSADQVRDPGGLITPPAASSSRLLRVNNRGTCEMCHSV